MSLLLDRLSKYQNDRRMMAALRCTLVNSKKHRAWPALNRLGIAIDDQVAAVVAGLFATHPDVATTGNFGSTCKTIEYKRGEQHGNDNKLTPIERRFQHLLSAEPGMELHDRVIRMVLMAKSQGVPVNYARLETDLRYWNDRNGRIKTEWATAFWTQGDTPAVEEEA